MASVESISQPVGTDTIQTTNVRIGWAAILLVMACLLWAGMVLGISCLEAPVKFTTPSLTRPVALDVGRVVFSAFNKVEIGWSMLLFWLFIIVRPFYRVPKLVGVLFVSLWLIVIFQSLVLLPMLTQRALLVMQGQPLSASPVHALYTSTEFIKLISLLFLGAYLLKSFLLSQHPR